jgi:hypothetical protein
LPLCFLGGATLHVSAARAGDLLGSAEIRYAQELAQRDAQPTETSASPDAYWAPTPWRAEIELMLWYAGVQGEVRAPGSSSEPQIEDIGPDDSRFTPAFEILLRDGDDDGTIRVAGFTFSQDTNPRADRAFSYGNVDVAAGDLYRATIDSASVEATYGWRWLHHRSKTRAGSRRGFDLRIDPYVGVRGYTMRFEVSSDGEASNERETWMDAIVGLRMEAEFSDEFSLDLMLDGGGMWWGDKASGSASVTAGFQWRPTAHVGAQIGYRFLYSGVSDDDGLDETRFSTSIAGLYGSVVFRF